ncbi:hypothetical protein U9M48_024723, partial [Paspalum notatum var. saurae]
MHHCKIRNVDWSVIEERFKCKLSNNDKWDVLCHPKDRVWSQGRFFGCKSFNIRDGSQTRFWEDTWVEYTPLKMQLSSLYSIVSYPHASVANVMNHEPL